MHLVHDGSSAGAAPRGSGADAEQRRATTEDPEAAPESQEHPYGQLWEPRNSSGSREIASGAALGAAKTR